MPGPSTDSKTEQTRGAATPMESAFGGISLNQAYQALDAYGRATSDPRIAARTIEGTLQQKQAELEEAKTAVDVAQYYVNQGGTWWGGLDVSNERLNAAKQKVSSLTSSMRDLEAQKEYLPQQLEQYDRTQSLANTSTRRLQDFLEGKDLGVSAEERDLITQGISGISQDVATTRGLNRTDVPVMQAIAPTVANSLLAQANANRSLFTGINQFQQGMDLSGRQLQAGLAGQNPAANLTGVYAGLRPSSFSTNTQQGYGALDYVNATANLASAAGDFMTGYKAK